MAHCPEVSWGHLGEGRRRRQREGVEHGAGGAGEEAGDEEWGKEGWQNQERGVEERPGTRNGICLPSIRTGGVLSHQ